MVVSSLPHLPVTSKGYTMEKNELVDALIPEYVGEVADLSDALIDLLDAAGDAGISKEVVILSAVSAVGSAVEHAVGMAVEETMPDGTVVYVKVTMPDAGGCDDGGCRLH